MSSKVLIDTSIWIEFFRGKDQKIRRCLSDLINSERAVLVGEVLAELLQGVKREEELNLLKDTIAALPYFEVTRRTWEKAGEILRKIRLKGITLPITDVLLATIAEENNCELLTSDEHFKKLEKVSFYKLPS